MKCRVAYNGTEWIIYLDREGVEFLWTIIMGDDASLAKLPELDFAKWDENYEKIIEPILRIKEAYSA